MTKQTVYVFQGGGALGAYQVGIIRALRAGGYSPDWIVGTSIGAINASIIAGNPHETRLEKLEQFWNKILWHIPSGLEAFSGLLPEWRRLQNHYYADLTMKFGLSGFFQPHWLKMPDMAQFSAALLSPMAKPAPDKLSFYDVTPLRKTLEELIDFDYLNSGDVRLSLGAVDIQSGEMVYFDNHQQKIGVEHIMASGALPPAFPAVEIDGRYYWDGGLHSNTPLSYVLENQQSPRISLVSPQDILCFIIQLFGPDDSLPTNFDDIEKRKKEISFGSRYKKHLQMHRKLQNLRRVIHELGEKMPESLKKQPEIAKLLAESQTPLLDVVHFRAPNGAFQLSSKDYEFSEASARELMQQGEENADRALLLAPWDKAMPKATALRLHEMGE